MLFYGQLCQLPGQFFKLPGQLFKLPRQLFKLPGQPFRLPGQLLGQLFKPAESSLTTGGFLVNKLLIFGSWVPTPS